MKDEDKTARSSAFTRNDDGLTNTYRTGDSAFLSFFSLKGIAFNRTGFHQGDRAQWKDGYIFILGRLDKVLFFSGGLEKKQIPYQ